MKRIVTLILAIAMLSTMLVGCGGKADKNTTQPEDQKTENKDGSTSGPVTIRYYDWDMVDQSVIDKFMEENPDIIVEVHDIAANGDRATQLDILAMSGEIDVMPQSDGDQFARFEEGMMANLDELVKKYNIDMEESFGDYAQWVMHDGSVYGIPYRTSRSALYFNKDIFDAAGVSYPDERWTNDDYMAAAAAISSWGKDNGGVYGTYSHTYGNEWAILPAQVGQWYTDDGKCNIRDEAWVRGLELRNEMDEKGMQMPYSEIKASGTVINSSFLGGMEGMTMAGSWLVRDMKKTDKFPFDFQVGIAPLPRWDDSVDGVRGNLSVSALCIPETSKNKEAAFRFITYLEMENSKAIATTGNVPCYIPAYDDDLIGIFVEGSSLSPDQAQFFFDTDVELTTNKIIGKKAGNYMSIIKEEAQPYFFGETDLETVLSNIESRVNDILAD